MEEAVADEDKDCSLWEGNVLFDMTPTNEFRSFQGFESILSAVRNLASNRELCLGDKNRNGSA